MDIKQFRKRTRHLLPKSSDLDIWILKCHLLIEEQINRLVEQGMCKKKHLKEARLSSYQKIKVAQSMMGLSGFEREWKFVQDLNTIRNKLAHNAEVEGLPALIDNAIKSFMSPKFKRSKTKKERIERLEFTVITTLGMFSGIEESHNRIFSKPGALLAWNTALYSDEKKMLE